MSKKSENPLGPLGVAQVEFELLSVDVRPVPPLLFGLLRGLLPVRAENVVLLALLRIA